MKTASLIRSEQNAVFSHLISIVESATTYRQLKSVWYEVRKIEKEIKEETGADTWILNYYQNTDLVTLYNEHKYNRFGSEVAEEMKMIDKTVIEIENMISKATTLDDLRQIARLIHTKVYKKDAKEYLNSIRTKAYQELMSA